MVKYKTGSRAYEITFIEGSIAIIKGTKGSYSTSPESLIRIDTDAPDVPHTNNSNHINSMQYFHTVVLVKEQPNNCVMATYQELVKYKVRSAHSMNDMRDTLVRELPKDVETKDCQFLISPIFN